MKHFQVRIWRNFITCSLPVNNIKLNTFDTMTSKFSSKRTLVLAFFFFSIDLIPCWGHIILSLIKKFPKWVLWLSGLHCDYTPLKNLNTLHLLSSSENHFSLRTQILSHSYLTVASKKTRNILSTVSEK